MDLHWFHDAAHVTTKRKPSINVRCAHVKHSKVMERSVKAVSRPLMAPATKMETQIRVHAPPNGSTAGGIRHHRIIKARRFTLSLMRDSLKKISSGVQ